VLFCILQGLRLVEASVRNSSNGRVVRYRQVCSGLTNERIIHNAVIYPSTRRVIKMVCAVAGFISGPAQAAALLFSSSLAVTRIKPVWLTLRVIRRQQGYLYSPLFPFMFFFLWSESENE
jgi:hypothetical protein